MNIQKHNDGGQKILTAFRNKSDIGNCAVMANLGNGEAASHEQTLPTWLGLHSRSAPDILIIKGWTQQQLDANQFPTTARDKKKVTLLFIEYKTCSDFQLDETAERIWEKYTPHAACPHPHRPHLFRDLRHLGWRVQGVNAAGELGTTHTHDRMLPILMGHAGFVLQSTVTIAFMVALELSRQAAHKLACDLNAHQVARASKIFGTAASLKRLGPMPAATATHTLPVPATALHTTSRPTGVG